MTYLGHFSRFCLAAVLLVAALLIAPSGAYAHAGHDHGTTKVQSSIIQSSSAVVSLQKAKADSSQQQSDPGGFLNVADSGQKSTAPCTGGCCSAGHGCCAAALPANVMLDDEVDRSTRVLARLLWGPGITPGALPEPPRYLI